MNLQELKFYQRETSYSRVWEGLTVCVMCGHLSWSQEVVTEL